MTGLDIVSQSKICIVEGFDMVGKTTFVKSFLKDHKYYHPRHDLTDYTVGRCNSWTIGYGIFDFLEQVGVDCKVVIDRCVASSYVYGHRITGNKYTVMDPEILDKVVDYYSQSPFFHSDSVCHVHINHYNMSSAKRLFELAKSRPQDGNCLSQKLDKFNTFSKYWMTYVASELMYQEVYLKLGISPITFSSIREKSYVDRVSGMTLLVKEEGQS